MNINTVRNDFEFFRAIDSWEGEPGTAYLDNAATTQRPDVVLQAVENFYKTVNSNPLRGLYKISLEATEAYERARKKVSQFIGAKRPEEIIFTKNATESLNLVAYSLCEKCVEEGDEIVITIAEHHSNMLPWRMQAKRRGATVKYIKPDETGYFSEDNIVNSLSEKTKILAMTHVSNVFGRENDLKSIAKICHDRGIFLVADGSQSVPHAKVNVTDLDVDFLAFSGHKMLGPMGIGVLYGKYDLLNSIPPFLGGGEM
ncbi:MAG: aminotransferase class V-fold PLP-dependent enzyme, partial [Eubacterium sp.]|nr:aminotransferase class V-fold PLP-dependent enzyme [Eubacterium sp.]